MHSKNELSGQFELHLLILFSKLYFFKLPRGGIFVYIFKDLWESMHSSNT